MAGKSRYSIADKQIRAFFAESRIKGFNRRQLEQIYADNNKLWNLPSTKSSSYFIDHVLKKEILKQIVLKFEGYVGKKELYITDGAEIFDIALSLFPRAYLSHFTAAFINQLTSQFPKTVYVTFEQTKKADRSKTSELQQENIDIAFSQPQRKATSKVIYDNYTIIAHNGMFTNGAGVFTREDNLTVTNIERTLIDITVRPAYGGGIHEVLKAYEAAKDKVSVNKLIGILNTINFTYPYAQAIGFYLQKAGYNQRFIDALKLKVSKFNFYLTYNMQETEFSKEWKLYYPKGM